MEISTYPTTLCTIYSYRSILRQSDGSLVAMKTKSRSRLNVEDDLIVALSCIELRISMLSNNKQAQPSH